jgi:hypothetical protein
MHGLKAAKSNALEIAHFLTLMVDRAARMALSFAVLEQNYIIWFTGPTTIHITHVGIRRQRFPSNMAMAGFRRQFCDADRNDFQGPLS